VLAAGKSERMGRPEALLPFRGAVFLDSILQSIAASSITDAVVVLGSHHEEIRSAVRMPCPVFNAEYEKGRVTSFQAGIRALRPEGEGAMFFLVDHPVVEAHTIDALIRLFRPGCIITPTFEGRRGHPVLFSRAVLEEILALPPDQGANIVVRKDPARIVEAHLQSPGILIDIDTPEDYARLLEKHQ
jgi:molybdenum cofactor cytidylyltransferase